MSLTTSAQTITRDELIRRAYRRLGIMNPSVNRMVLARALLNDIVKEIDAEGRLLFTIPVIPSSLTLIAAQQDYTDAAVDANHIAKYMMALEWAEIVNGSSRTPLQIITKDEAIRSWERDLSGTPFAVYLKTQPQGNAQFFRFYPIPNAAFTVKYNYRRRLFDFDPDDGTCNPDFPQEWNHKLVKRLAYELAPEFGIPLAEREVLKAESDEAMAKGFQGDQRSESGVAPRPKGIYY